MTGRTLGVFLLLLIAVSEYQTVAVKIEFSRAHNDRRIRTRLQSKRGFARVHEFNLSRVELLLSQLADPSRAASYRMITHELLTALGPKPDIQSLLSTALHTCVPPSQPISADAKRVIALFQAVVASKAFIAASAKSTGDAAAIVQNAKSYADGLIAHGRDKSDCDKFHTIVSEVLPVVASDSSSPSALIEFQQHTQQTRGRTTVTVDPFTLYLTGALGLTLIVVIVGCGTCRAAPAPVIAVPAAVAIATNVAVELVGNHAVHLPVAAACQIMYNGVAGAAVNAAMFAGAFAGCAALAAHLQIDVTTLQAVFNAAQWINRIESRPNAGGGVGAATNPTVFGGNTPVPGAGRHFRVVLNPLMHIVGQFRRHHNGAGQFTPAVAKPCWVATVAAGIAYNNAVVDGCGQDLIAAGNLVDANGLRAVITFTADHHNVHTAPGGGVGTPYAHGAGLLIRKPADVEIHENIPRVTFAGGAPGGAGVVDELVDRVWVTAGLAVNWHIPLATAINTEINRINVRRATAAGLALAGSAARARLAPFQAITIGNAHTSAGNAVCSYHGAPVAWGTGTGNPNRVFIVEYFRDNVIQALTAAGVNLQNGAGAVNERLNIPNLNFPYYFNRVSVGFAGAAPAHVGGAAAAVPTTVAAINNVSPSAFLAVLNPHVPLSPARTLKRDLEQHHGRVRNHWGVLYAQVSLRVFKTITPPVVGGVAGQYDRPNADTHSYVRHVGWVCSAANTAVTVHTERMCLEELRHFTNALEAVVSADGVTHRVVGLTTRFILDYFPDATVNESYCTWAIAVAEEISHAGCFRTLGYTENARQWILPAGGAHAITRPSANQWIATQRGGLCAAAALVPADVIEFAQPKVTYTYTDTAINMPVAGDIARTQVRNRRAAHAKSQARGARAALVAARAAALLPALGAGALNAWEAALETAFNNADAAVAAAVAGVALPPGVLAPAAANAITIGQTVPPNQLEESRYEDTNNNVKDWHDPGAAHHPV